jgi:cell division protein FtsB
LTAKKGKTVSEVDPEDIEKTIKAIQNIAIMLTGAREYVCEGRILRGFSKDIEANLKKLETNIGSLKKKFPGKFPETLSPDTALSRIRDVANRLKRDTTDVEAKCRSGELGTELNVRTLELRNIVNDALNTVSGRVSRYGTVDRIADCRERVKSLFFAFSSFAPYKGKGILGVTLVAAVCFVYLYFTMESEHVLLGSINQDLAFIEEQKDVLKQQRWEYRQIRAKIKSLESKELIRERKIEFLNLSKEERRIKELLDKTTISIERRQREVAEKKRKAEEIQKKSFFQKLFRR